MLQRKILPHERPAWVPDDAIYFITINTTPPGVDQLCGSERSALIRESAATRMNRGEWFIHLLLLMPDHLHAFMSFPRDGNLRSSISQWKRYVARQAGVRWQRDFFDHRLRNDENYVEKAHYIRMNPVRKGLCGDWKDWPHVWTTEEIRRVGPTRPTSGR